MNKVYEYNGKHYCETDLSMMDDNYAGDLFDLYWDASQGDLKGDLCDETVYYAACNPEEVFASAEELVEWYFEDCVVEEVE